MSTPIALLMFYLAKVRNIFEILARNGEKCCGIFRKEVFGRKITAKVLTLTMTVTNSATYFRGEKGVKEKVYIYI